MAGRVLRLGWLLKRLRITPQFLPILHNSCRPVETVGYDLGWDTRCYPPGGGCDYINVSARLDPGVRRTSRGGFVMLPWFTRWMRRRANKC
ncbi:MAG: hypothetical protein Ct9H300mP1_24920 [Planctomycetaceae bacterium]|nr:MAG: hypothetical protein Ct9H300mP1_24920 [Planctomycetaceae bacterium]